MATHSSVLAWRIPGTGEPGGLPSLGSHRAGHNWRDLAAAADENVGEGNGTPLQYSCLENPMMEEPGRLQSMRSQRVGLSDLTFTFHFDALEKEMATPLQCSCLENPRDGGAWWAAVYGVAQSWKRLSSSSSTAITNKKNIHFLLSMGSLGVGHDWATSLFTFHFHALEKEMATPLQCSCLENPRNGGVWWAAVYGVAQSRTRLKRLSSSKAAAAKTTVFT